MPGPRYGTIDRAYAQRLATADPADDDPVWMVNLMRYREQADYTDGRDTDLTGREADDLYAPLGPLAAVGAEIVYVAEVEAQLLGEGDGWDRVAIVRYPTRRSFMEMQEREDYQDLHVHKDAGLKRTFVIGCRPMEPQPDAGTDGLQRDWAEVEHPPTDDDGVCHVLHVIRWNDGGAETMEGYHAAAFGVAGRHGARIAGWFDVDGTIIGDGRGWDEVRFNEFPSLAAFMAVVRDPARLAAQTEYREPAMADTYALVLRPVINQLRFSIGN